MDERGTIIILSALMIAAIATGFTAFFLERRRRKMLVLEIEAVLAGFKDADREKGLFNELWGDRNFEAGSEDIDRILRQLDKLNKYIKAFSQKMNSEKEETRSMVTDIAHQLKTPVSVLDMSLSILEDEGLSAEERREFLSRARSSMNELETLMESLIQISRMETGLIELKPEKHELADTITTAINRIISKADEKNISFQLEDEEKLSEIAIKHDVKWLSEALINIFDNSIKYSPANSTVTIRLFNRNGFLRMEIEDQGIGIPKDERNKVLTRFYRGKSELVSAAKGSGVGLYLADKIVRMHEGMVFVHQGHGQTAEFPGTEIVIHLPVTL